eukprot:GHRR01015672.1.p2 GENE.GHRR01015672.1~~GHRR01015672.1.p2  ORF type:complete len:143 (-),score=34.86 GHRR01015672.1:1660-2088(-)
MSHLDSQAAFDKSHTSTPGSTDAGAAMLQKPKRPCIEPPACCCPRILLLQRACWCSDSSPALQRSVRSSYVTSVMRFAAAAKSFCDLVRTPAAMIVLKLISSVNVLKFLQNSMTCTYHSARVRWNQAHSIQAADETALTYSI